MTEFLNAYLELGGPAVLAGLAVGALVYLAFGGRDMRTLFQAAGYGVIAGMLTAAAMAAAGGTSSHLPVVVAVIAGAIGGFVLRPRRI